jgi:hypothetical protein
MIICNLTSQRKQDEPHTKKFPLPPEAHTCHPRHKFPPLLEPVLFLSPTASSPAHLAAAELPSQNVSASIRTHTCTYTKIE